MTGQAHRLPGTYRGVPWRSHEVSRIEALSDAVFALAITLLIVALEVPETFAELWTKMRGLPAFALSFAMLFHLWRSQHLFFRRYGLQDAFTTVLNWTLLFLVLFYMLAAEESFTWPMEAPRRKPRGGISTPGEAPRRTSSWSRPPFYRSVFYSCQARRPCRA